MNRISQLRKSRNIKQSDLAKVLGVVQATLSNWETGKFDIDNNSLIKVANYFDVTTDYLLCNTDDSTPPFKAPETFYTVPMEPPPQKEKAPNIEGLASDPLIAFYGDIKEHLSQDDLDDIQTIMKAKAERNKGKKQDELGRKGL